VHQPTSGACRRLILSRASIAATLLCLSTILLHAQPPASATPSNELDAFMARVLAKRDVNRQTLQQYILDDAETFEILGPGRTPLHRGRRDFAWYVRDGMHVRSPVRFDGVTVGEEDRRKYEDNWIKQERERIERRAKREAEKGAKTDVPDPTEPDGPPVGGGAPIATPRFVSEAYFMDFKFEAGNYYLAGREELEGHKVLRIEYYPTRMFDDHPDEDKNDSKPEEKKQDDKKPRRQPKEPSDKEKKLEEDINRKMNKTALVTLWVDPAEYQIVKYTFDNVWMDFLPGGWLVRVDDIRASMTMGQPFPGVWLPREMNVHAGVSLAAGPFEASYARRFTNYKLAEVKSIIRIPKEARGGVPLLPSSLSGEADTPFPGGDAHGPSVRDDDPQAEVVREIRVHGNAAVLDEDVIKLAGLTVGQELPPGAIEAIEQRLKQSGKFETVEVRKRYRSLADESDVAIVLLVHERPGTTSVAGVLRRPSRPFGRVGDRLMFLPILNYSDGYGFTYGGLMSARDTLGMGERIAVPLTWGGTRRAALEIDRTFKSGPFTRVESSLAIWQRENPHFGLDDRRVELKGRVERRLTRYLRMGAQASQSSVDFGGLDDHLWTFGADAAFDTRADPTFPRNAFVLSTGWNGLHIRSEPARIDRYTSDARGYVGLIGQAVGAARVQYTTASSPLPDYERLLLGGASTLRGFRTGTFDGDRTLVTSAEVRVPISSVLSSARLGVIGFFDAAKAWDFGTRFEDARWHKGVGGGVFLLAPLVKLNLDVAHGLTDGDTRLHLGVGFAF
jgi:Omp85 superfamily domain/Surface antigen variable number repeat